MILRQIDILNFKNIAGARLDFSDSVNCLLGKNGMGKSNLLEAIHFLCLTRPMSAITESSLIRHGEDSTLVKGVFDNGNGTVDEVSCGIVRGKGKSVRRNGKEYQRIAMHIGAFPVVCVSPADSVLVTGGAENRRRLADVVISQADGQYLAHAIRYNRALESRNKMLRAGVRDKLLYESVEAGMVEAAAKIHEARKKWIEDITPDFKTFYKAISGDAEKASISYKSALNDAPLDQLLEASRQKDTILGFSTQGIHRDDFTTSLGNYSMRALGSQGQVKSFTVALRMAIFRYLRKLLSITPVLLLDDIFDKLDSSRVGNIMEIVSSGGDFGQIFITDTNREHLDEILDHIQSPSLMLGVENGNFMPIK